MAGKTIGKGTDSLELRKEPALDRLFGREVEVLVSEQADHLSEHSPATDQAADDALRRLTALYEIGQTLAATLDLHEIFEVMFREIAQGLLGAQQFVVALYDHDSGMIRCGFAIVDGEEADPTQFPPLPLGDGPVSDTIRSREPRIVDLRELYPQLQANGRAVLRGTERVPQSALYVPMVSGDRVVGVMHIQHYEAERFRAADLPLLSTLASQAGVALTNAQLYAREQERVNALALALQKQQELDQLRTEILQNVSHELRTPLAIAYGYVQMLESGDLGAPNPDHEGPLHIIAQRMEMLRQLVENITLTLDADEPEMPQEPVHLGYLLQMLQPELELAAQRVGVNLIVKLDPNLPAVLGCNSRLQRMAHNLVDNALKFTPRGGVVTVRLVGAEQAVLLQVTDTGIGIPPDQLERVFERFVQVDGSATRRYGGVGLGLALVKDVVEAHGGTITLDSVVGQGSRFQVRLPSAHAARENGPE